MSYVVTSLFLDVYRVEGFLHTVSLYVTLLDYIPLCDIHVYNCSSLGAARLLC